MQLLHNIWMRRMQKLGLGASFIALGMRPQFTRADTLRETLKETSQSRFPANNQKESNCQKEGQVQKEPKGEYPPAISGSGDKKVDASLGSSLYVRTDQDKTTVVSPRVYFRSELGKKGTSLDLVYTADIWSSASVDIRTAATPTVVEQRDEVDAAVSHAWKTWSAALSYRFSHEPDYISNALSANLSYEGWQRNTTLQGRVSYAYDLVGRSGDSTLNRSIQSFGVWLGFTQVLTKWLLLQVNFEQRYSSGFLSSVYRFVPLDSTRTCADPSSVCLAEVHPDTRLRNAGVMQFRAALGSMFSLGAGYRFYGDTWKLFSHTMHADISALLRRELVMSLGYRAYLQGAASFYQSRYNSSALPAFVTRDRELSPMNSHGLTLRSEYDAPIIQNRFELTIGGMLSGTRYRYRDFVGLDQVDAFEVAINLGAAF